jgi:hypothetical protein
MKRPTRKATLEDSVTYILAEIKELEACQYLLTQIIYKLTNDYAPDDTLSDSVAKITERITRKKCRLFEQLATISVLSPTAEAKLKQRLIDKLNKSGSYFSNFVNQSWTDISTNPEELKQTIKDQMSKALQVREDEVDMIAVPKRKLEPDL